MKTAGHNKIYAVLVCVNIIVCSPIISLTAQTRTIKIDPTVTYQTIDNFTASDAWSGEFVGRYWGDQQKRQIAEWLFCQRTDNAGHPKGIGLSMWRVNLGGGTLEQENPDIQPYWRRAESYLSVDGRNYDWGKCSGQRYFMKQAVEYGCNNFLLFSNTPLIQYTKNGKGWASSVNEANIRPENYGAFANYLADVTEHFMNKGWNISYISPINEPNVVWNIPRQEGSSWRIDEMYKMYKALNSALSTRSGMDNVKIVVGESGELRYLYEYNDYVKTNFNGTKGAPAELVQNFWSEQSLYFLGNLKHVPRMIAGHDYWSEKTSKDISETRLKVKEVCDEHKIDFQQTEWCMLPPSINPVKDGFTADWDGDCANMQAALLMGRLIHTNMTIANAKAWGYWKGLEVNGSHALIALYPDKGDIHNGGKIAANKLLWGLGNYSFFIRPGYKRVSAVGADNLDGLCISAYVSPLKDKIILVGVNTGFKTEIVNFKLSSEFREKIKNVFVYRTDERTDLALVQSTENLSEVCSIAPRSLTTIVFNLGTAGL